METMKELYSNLSREMVGEFQLAAAALLYGFAFVFQKYAMGNGFGPFAFNAYRYVISAILVYATKPYMKSIVHTSKDEETIDLNMSESERSAQETRHLWFWGLISGLTMFGGSTLQQLGT
jgi:drug/metabolite transporter (DMT)-like permease